MLVLTRKLQETIQIGENITITIVRIKGNTVRVGIEAPRDVRVARGEVFTRELSGKAHGESTSDSAEFSQDDSPSDATGRPVTDEPAAPWQVLQGDRRSRQFNSGRASQAVTTYAV
jgi:carbon storage regulator CsrA